jgi:hypothetical protein
VVWLRYVPAAQVHPRPEPRLRITSSAFGPPAEKFASGPYWDHTKGAMVDDLLVWERLKPRQSTSCHEIGANIRPHNPQAAGSNTPVNCHPCGQTVFGDLLNDVLSDPTSGEQRNTKQHKDCDHLKRLSRFTVGRSTAPRRRGVAAICSPGRPSVRHPRDRRAEATPPVRDRTVPAFPQSCRFRRCGGTAAGCSPGLPKRPPPRLTSRNCSSIASILAQER